MRPIILLQFFFVWEGLSLMSWFLKQPGLKPAADFTAAVFLIS
jgi:hypothetical protein